MLSLINVPTDLPLNAPMNDVERTAQSKVEQAKLLCGQRVSGSVVRIRPGQAGAAIAETAEEIGAGAVVMQLTYRNGEPLYGKTLKHVLAKRPCRVIVSAQPEEARA